jgi:hypothetical protein
MMRTRAFFLVLVLTVILYSCENRQDETIVNLGFKAVVNSEGTTITTRSSAAEGLLVDSAVIILRNISLKQNGENNSLVATGPLVINLLTKNSDPGVSTTAVRPGTYNGLEAQLVVPGNTGFSISITGTYTLDDRWWKFRYSYNKEGSFSAANDQGIIINEFQVNNIWVLIDVISLFRE